MKTLLSILAFISIIVIIPAKSHAQQTVVNDSFNRELIQQYRTTLNVDSSKAAAIVVIQGNYKTRLKEILATTGLTDMELRRRIGAEMADKNRKLKLLLNPAEQAKIIPTTELYMEATDSVKVNTQSPHQ